MEGILRFKMDWAVTIKQLALTVHGLIFGRAYYRKDFCVGDLGGLFSGGLFFFCGGGGGLLSEFYGIVLGDPGAASRGGMEQIGQKLYWRRDKTNQVCRAANFFPDLLRPAPRLAAPGSPRMFLYTTMIQTSGDCTSIQL